MPGFDLPYRGQYGIAGRVRPDPLGPSDPARSRTMIRVGVRGIDWLLRSAKGRSSNRTPCSRRSRGPVSLLSPADGNLVTSSSHQRLRAEPGDARTTPWSVPRPAVLGARTMRSSGAAGSTSASSGAERRPGLGCCAGRGGERRDAERALSTSVGIAARSSWMRREPGRCSSARTTPDLRAGRSTAVGAPLRLAGDDDSASRDPPRCLGPVPVRQPRRRAPPLEESRQCRRCLPNCIDIEFSPSTTASTGRSRRTEDRNRELPRRYHCAVAHPGFSAMVETSPGDYRLERGWHPSQFGRPRT
jgi:hypothetical protein